MSPRATVLLGVVTLLVGILYFATVPDEADLELPQVTLLGEPRFIDPSVPVERVLELDADRVTRITIRRGKTELSAVRDDGQWRGVERAQRAEDLLASMKDLVVLTTIESAAVDLGSYGLGDAERQIILEREGAPPLRLDIGHRNPAGTAVYVRADDDPVVLAGALILWEFDKAFAAFHKKGTDLFSPAAAAPPRTVPPLRK